MSPCWDWLRTGSCPLFQDCTSTCKAIWSFPKTLHSLLRTLFAYLRCLSHFFGFFLFGLYVANPKQGQCTLGSACASKGDKKPCKCEHKKGESFGPGKPHLTVSLREIKQASSFLIVHQKPAKRKCNQLSYQTQSRYKIEVLWLMQQSLVYFDLFPPCIFCTDGSISQVTWCRYFVTWLLCAHVKGIEYYYLLNLYNTLHLKISGQCTA